MKVRNAATVPVEPVSAGRGTLRQTLIGPDQGAHFQMRRFIMEPGGGMPRHTNTVEHQQYVLRGKARIGIGGDVFQVQPGDVVYIPPGTPHWYEADGDEAFEFLCMVPNLPDQIRLEPEDA